jgi:hypothetical protein
MSSPIRDLIKDATNITINLSPSAKWAVIVLVFVLSGIFLTLLALLFQFKKLWLILLGALIISVITYFLLNH